MNEEKIEKKIEDKKWQRPGRIAVCGQVPKWMADKMLEVANNNNISRTKVLEDALDCYFNDRIKEVVKEVEVVKEIPAKKGEFTIELDEMDVNSFAVILELSEKMKNSYIGIIELLCKYIVKREGQVETKYLEKAKKIYGIE